MGAIDRARQPPAPLQIRMPQSRNEAPGLQLVRPYPRMKSKWSGPLSPCEQESLLAAADEPFYSMFFFLFFIVVRCKWFDFWNSRNL
jgi:hypothetical protein